MPDSNLEPQFVNSQTDESGLAEGQVPPPIASNGQSRSATATATNSNLSSEAAAALAAADLAGKRRRWPILVVGAALGAVGAWAAITLTDDDGSGGIATEEDVALGSASVVLGDLLEEVEWAGSLGYGDTITVAASGGTITAAAALGETLQRGDVIALVDNEPVVAFFGATPMWRDLAEGSEGLDVLQIEANLAALGYDPDQTVDIDQTYTANTEAMVERWQEAIGAEVTGRIARNSVAIVDGPSIVSTAPVVGAAASGVLATVTPRSAITDVVATADGVVGSLAPVGSAIEHGSVLLTVDDEPMVALVDLGPVGAVLVSGSFTFTELEQALADSGYDPDDEMTVDGVVTDATTAAVERWQAATGLPVTGQADSAYYLLIPSGRQVESHLVSDGAAVVTGGPILTASTSRLLIETVVDVADADEFELGQQVTIELADETQVDGMVSAISSIIQPANPQNSPTVEVSFELLTEPGQDVVEGAVTITSFGEEIRGAIVVPTRALVTLAEGGFAVEKILSDGSNQLIGIELGAFDDGVVEVVSGDLAPGDEVVVPH